MALALIRQDCFVGGSSGCAIMAFAQSANLLVEPNLALYEAAVAGGSEAANNELRQFRLADNQDTKYWVDLAIGRIEKLSIPKRELPALPNNSEENDFEMRLRRWLRNYIILLKLAVPSESSSIRRAIASLVISSLCFNSSAKMSALIGQRTVPAATKERRCESALESTVSVERPKTTSRNKVQYRVSK